MRLTRGAIGALALCALAACGTAPKPAATPSLLAQPATNLGILAGVARKPVVAGESLHMDLLRRFYARHGFRPVWASRPEQTDALIAAVLGAGDQGLDPDMFHGDLLRRRATLPPGDREVLLSDAFLTYADALARGAVPVERRGDDQTLTPGPIDVTAVLDEAMDSSDPRATIEALAPVTPTYKALREALQTYRVRALSGDKTAIGRVRTIEVNLERQRWLPRPLPADRAWVNAADERLVLYHDHEPVFSTRVVVGQDVKHNQSPEFEATIDASFFNPPWVIPRDIVKAEILPKISQDPTYLTRNKMVMLDNGEVEQLPSPEAGLGLIMFDMPNKFDVYLHDTPDRDIFNRDNRRISHGCIRVQNPIQFASLLLRQPVSDVNQGIAQGIVKASTTRHALPRPVPVFVVYQTAFLGGDGTLQFRPDFYQRDAGIWQQLHRRGAEGLVQPVQAARRPGPPSTKQAPLHPRKTQRLLTKS